MHMFYVFEDGQLLKKLKIKNQRVEDAQIRTMRFIEKKIMSYMDNYFVLHGSISCFPLFCTIFEYHPSYVI